MLAHQWKHSVDLPHRQRRLRGLTGAPAVSADARALGMDQDLSSCPIYAKIGHGLDSP